MKILIEQKMLADRLNTAARIASKAANVVPALAGVHLEAVNGTLTFTANNLEMAVKTSTKEVEIIQEGEVLTNAQYLADFISKLNSGPISLELTKSAKLGIKYGKNKGNINTLNKTGWAEPQVDGNFGEKFVVKSNQLKKALDAVIFAAANDHYRKVFTGVLFDVKDDGVINLVASDTHKLALYVISDVESTKEGQFIAPTKYLKEVVRVLKDTEDPVVVSSNNSILRFELEETLVHLRLLDGQYPDYQAIMPTTAHSMSMATDNLKSSLERIRSLPQEDKTKLPAAKFRVNGNEEVKIEYTSDIAGAITEVIALEESAALDEEMYIVLNANYMQEIAKSLGTKTHMRFSGPMTPILITGEEETAKYVLVPMR